MPAWIARWDGGRVYLDRRKRKIYVIERMVEGERYAVRLPPNVRDPDAELALFMRDPAGYAERNTDTGLMPSEAVVITLEEVQAFKRYQLDEKHLNTVYATSVSHYLTDWANALKGKDLRRVRVDELYRLLDEWKAARNYRIAALKSFCTYLVKRQRLGAGENAAAHLESVKAPPARLLEVKGYTIKQVEQFYKALGSQRVRDYFCLGAKYGLHGSEIDRIARGQVEVTLVGVKGIAAVLRFIHKGRHDHRQSIDAQALAAVRRMTTHGRAPTTTMVKDWVDATAAQLSKGKPQPFPKVFHHYLRHSHFTWMRQCGRKVEIEAGGLALSEIAALVGHRSLLMGKDYYDNSEVPPMAVLPLKLYHPEDPISIEIGAAERTEATN
jgi:integrase